MPVDHDAIRRRFAALAAERGYSLASLSRLIGRNDAYLQQYLVKGSPAKLDEDDRLILAQFLNVDERERGAREPWKPSSLE